MEDLCLVPRASQMAFTIAGRSHQTVAPAATPPMRKFSVQVGGRFVTLE